MPCLQPHALVEFPFGGTKQNPASASWLSRMSPWTIAVISSFVCLPLTIFQNVSRYDLLEQNNRSMMKKYYAFVRFKKKTGAICFTVKWNVPLCSKEGTPQDFFRSSPLLYQLLQSCYLGVYCSNCASLDLPIYLLTIILWIEDPTEIIMTPFTEVVVATISKLGIGAVEDPKEIITTPFTKVIIATISKLGIGAVSLKLSLPPSASLGLVRSKIPLSSRRAHSLQLLSPFFTRSGWVG